MTETPLPANDRLTALSPSAGTTTLDFDFELTREDGLTVIRLRDGARATLVKGVDFSFPSGLGDTDGGSILLAEATVAGDAFFLAGAHPLERLSDFLASSAFDTAKINADLDALTIIAQELARNMSRALKFDFGVGADMLPIPAPVAGKGLVGNAAGDGFEAKFLSALDGLASDDFGELMLQTATLAAALTLLGLASDDLPTFLAVREGTGTITGTTPAISAANGGLQTWTLTDNSTPTDGLSNGDSVTLHVDHGTGYAINWTSLVNGWVGGSAPSLPASGLAVIELWKIGGNVYGAHAGDLP